MSAKKSGFVPKSFRDAGTGEYFEGGKEHLFEPGAYANFVAAGLIGDKPETAGKSDSKADSKTQNASA